MTKAIARTISRPIVWSIAASDSGGGAGIQADLNTLHSLGCHGCNIITAITAQNSLAITKITPITETDLDAQWQALETDMPPEAIKIGLLPQPSAITWLTNRLTLLKETKRSVMCIWDPVLKASTGATLLESCSPQLIDPLLRQLDLITPNLSEAEQLTGITINNFADIELAAQQLLNRGVSHVLIKGGHSFSEPTSHCRDYFASKDRCFWLSHKKQNQPNNHGTGCTLASAIASFSAHRHLSKSHHSSSNSHELSDSIVLANRFIQQSLRLAAPQGQGAGPVWQASLENHPKDFAELTPNADYFKHNHKQQFRKSASNLGLYAIVDNLHDLECLIDQGVDTLQWRVKCNLASEPTSQKHASHLKAAHFKQAIHLCQQAQVPLYINDNWQLALEYGAYGIHLGQEDLANISHAQLNHIKTQGIRLGISCHNETELAYAHSLKPSYIAFGPVFTPHSKNVDHPPLGLKALRQWQESYGQLYPTTCIGGIDLQNLKDVLATGIRSVAVISAVNNRHNSRRFIEAFAEFSAKDPR